MQRCSSDRRGVHFVPRLPLLRVRHVLLTGRAGQGRRVGGTAWPCDQGPRHGSSVHVRACKHCLHRPVGPEAWQLSAETSWTPAGARAAGRTPPLWPERHRQHCCRGVWPTSTSHQARACQVGQVHSAGSNRGRGAPPPSAACAIQEALAEQEELATSSLGLS